MSPSLRVTARRALSGALLLALAAACGGPPRKEGDIQLRTLHQPPPDARLLGGETGVLEPAQIRAVMLEQQAGFNNCFQQAGGAFVSGEALLQFIVKPNGRVEHVWVARSDLGSHSAEDCLVQTARFLEFPVPAGGKARFAYPFEWNAPGRRLSVPEPVQWGYPILFRHRELFQRCRDEHGFKGPFNLTVYVGRLGQVLNVGYDSGDPPGDTFPACVVEVTRNLRFPNPGQKVVKYQALVEDLSDVPTEMNKDIGG